MLYVFDLDDTLYLERDYVKSGFKAVQKWLESKKYCLDFFDEAWDLFCSGVRKEIFDLVLEKNDMDLEPLSKQQLIFKMVEIYRKHSPDIRFSEDTVDCFEHIRALHDIALITDGNKYSQWSKIQSLGIDMMIETIFVTDRWGKAFWKPNPYAYVLAQKGRSPKECIYIGDNPHKDFIAPQRLGWQPSVRIKRDGALHESVATPDGCIEISSLLELTV